MLAAFHVDQTSHFKSRHSPALGNLAHKLAVEQRDYVDRILEPYAKFSTLAPRDLAWRALTGRKLDRDALAERCRKITSNRDTQRRNLSDRASAANARVVDCSRVEGALVSHGAGVIRPRQTLSDNDRSD